MSTDELVAGARVRLLVWDPHTLKGDVVEAVLVRPDGCGGWVVDVGGKVRVLWPDELRERIRRAREAVLQATQQAARAGRDR